MDVKIKSQAGNTYSISIPCVHCRSIITINDLSKESMDSYLLFSNDLSIAFPKLSSMEIYSLEHSVCISCQISKTLSDCYESTSIRR